MLGHLLALTQVSVPRSAVGNAANAWFTPSRTAAAPCSPGRCTSITNRARSSTKVPIADRLPVPMIKSPSQCPACWRPSTWLGR